MRVASSSWLLSMTTALLVAWRVRGGPGRRLLRDALLWLRADAARRPQWRDRSGEGNP